MIRGIDQPGVNFPRSFGRRCGGGTSQRRHDLVAALADLGAIVRPRLRDPAQDFHETRLSVAIFRRKIGAADKWLEPGRQPDVERPAAAAGRGLDEGHVNAIDIRTFLPVDFNIHEPRVHEGRDFFVLERLALHHVAPMAGGITDREKNRLLLPACFGKGFLAPGIPINRVVGVLEKVGRFFLGEPVGVLNMRGRRRSSGWWSRCHICNLGHLHASESAT